MIRLNIGQVKDQLSKYIEMVEAGATVVICKRNVPVAEIRPIERKKKRLPRLGWADGQGRVPASFGAPLSEDELQLWEGGDPEDPLAKYALRRSRRKK